MVAPGGPILVDTRYVLWHRIKPGRLTQMDQNIISNAAPCYVSIVSIWEIALLQGLGRVPADRRLLDVPSGFDLLELNKRHCEVYAALPLYHRDPFDRMLVAQAESEQMPLLTRDRAMRGYHAHATFIP